MRFWRHARLAAVILVVAAILAVALWPEATDVDLARAERGPMQVTIDEDGETRVRERFGVDLSLHALFASPTVAGLSTRVDERRAQQAPRGKAARAATQLKVLSRNERERLLQQVRAARKAAE